MDRTFKIKTLTLSNNSEYVYLADKEGVMTYDENLYILQCSYNLGKSVAAAKATLSALQLLSYWEDRFEVHISDKFKNGDVLTYSEVRSICQFLRFKFSFIKSPISDKYRTKAGSIKTKKNFKYKHYNNVNTQIIRIKYIDNYLHWLHSNLQPREESKRSEMSKNFKKFTPTNTLEQGEINNGISNEISKKVLFDISPTNKHNYFGRSIKDKNTKKALQLRNYILISLLYETGMRRGELLSLRIEDIDFNTQKIYIKRRQDDGIDPRSVKPYSKTRERSCSLSIQLLYQLELYTERHRNGFSSAQLHPFIFISHHGTNSGNPLSISAFNSIFKKIKKNTAIVGINDFQPHALRHAWNYRFSQKCDKNRDKISFTEEHETRCYLMGWCPLSKMAELYNRRHIKEKAGSISLEMQNDLNHLLERGKDEKK